MRANPRTLLDAPCHSTGVRTRVLCLRFFFQLGERTDMIAFVLTLVILATGGLPEINLANVSLFYTLAVRMRFLAQGSDALVTRPPHPVSSPLTLLPPFRISETPYHHASDPQGTLKF